MRLLIVTQAVDKNDLFLGFFHGWLEEFSKHFAHITVICLKKGVFSLPENVEVLSLGKESSTSRPARVWRFYRFIISRRNEYDAVLVHMNEEYVLLGGWLWKRWRKRVYMWRNHYSGSKRTDSAARWCDKIFCTSKFSYTMKYPKTVLMPVGVDTELYRRLPDVPRDPCAVLFYARLSPSKRPDMLLEALYALHRKGVSFSADFYGTPLPKDEPYLEALKTKTKTYGLEDTIRFMPGAPHREGPRIFNAHAIFADLGLSGMYNKMLFEAAACECMVLTSSKDFAELVDKKFIFEENSVEDLAQKLEGLLNLSLIEQQGAGSQLRNIAKQHSVSALSEHLVREI
ncbi:MAG: glycosyltransferase family 4 protein [Patescibacteria group bacterium]|nr:glycosyltransferase family 4 protein [Patescibacteria group bacterium]